MEGSRFVEACPGAGKTRAIVARFLKRASVAGRVGTALLSFTNAAVAEVTTRCGNLHVLEAPNFAGTFDTFINRYITGPYYATRSGVAPRFVDSWNSIPATTFSVFGLEPYLKFDLEWFDIDDEAATLDAARVRTTYRTSLLSAYADKKGAVDDRASQVFRRYVLERGVLSSSASRKFALAIINERVAREVLGGLLAARFGEVIVDEAQDCGVEELEILRFLRQFGVEVVAVADLDQAIFEFRRATPHAVRDFAAELPAGSRLSGNFRSSPAICEINRRLRVAHEPDEPRGVLADCSRLVRLVVFNALPVVRGLVASMLEEEDLTATDVRVLAHRRRDASRAAGWPDMASGSDRKVMQIARAHQVLVSDADALRKRRAVTTIERVLLELTTSAGTREHSTPILGEHLGIDPRWLRDAALRVGLAASPSIGRSEYTITLRSTVNGLTWPDGIQLENVGQKLGTPPVSDWGNLTTPSVTALPWDTVHASKGREFSAVVLVIPQSRPVDDNGRSCLDLWEQDVDGESRRVLYVGASRAQRILVLAVHTSHEERVRALAFG